MMMLSSTHFFSLLLKLVSFFSSLRSAGRELNMSTYLQQQPFVEMPSLVPDTCLTVPLSVGCCTLKLNSCVHIAVCLLRRVLEEVNTLSLVTVLAAWFCTTCKASIRQSSHPDQRSIKQIIFDIGANIVRAHARFPCEGRRSGH